MKKRPLSPSYSQAEAPAARSASDSRVPWAASAASRALDSRAASESAWARAT